MSVKYYHHNSPFLLEGGGRLDKLTIAYHTYGTLNPDRSNVIWVCHALTANSDVADWWPHTVEKDAFLDPEENFVVCANILGSHYGTTGPLSINPATGQPYYDTFPAITIRDMARAHALLADHLGIESIDTLVGSSVGGFQALQWAVDQPQRFRRMVLIATDSYASPWTIAIDETQRMAIKADQTYGLPTPDAGMKGLAAARAIGLLTYRGPEGYDRTQQDTPETSSEHGIPATHRACTYQQYQGQKLCRRYNAYSYVTILDAFDTHNVGRGHGSRAQALASLGRIPTLAVGISTDIVFTPATMQALAAAIPGAQYVEIDSPFGHDGFLVEHAQLNTLIKQFLSTHG